MLARGECGRKVELVPIFQPSHHGNNQWFSQFPFLPGVFQVSSILIYVSTLMQNNSYFNVSLELLCPAVQGLHTRSTNHRGHGKIVYDVHSRALVQRNCNKAPSPWFHQLQSKRFMQIIQPVWYLISCRSAVQGSFGMNLVTLKFPVPLVAVIVTVTVAPAVAMWWTPSHQVLHGSILDSVV